MLHISLFSGIGGFDLAAEWAGWTNAVSCEINPFGRKVLEHYWPDAYHHDDIHTLTIERINEELTKRHGEQWRTDDIVLSGGFPCQPYSLAGKRLGKNDDRHLWPEMLRVIREVRPTYIVCENVSGLVNWSDGLVFDEVQSDLEAIGYEVQSFILPACAVNAPHRRDRAWIIAYANGLRYTRKKHRKAESGVNNKSISQRIATNAEQQRRERPDKPTGSIRFEQRTWDNWPTTEPKLCSRNDGFPAKLDGITFSKWRNESIKAAGNAVVPQVVLKIFEAINTIHNHNTTQ